MSTYQRTTGTPLLLLSLLLLPFSAGAEGTAITPSALPAPAVTMPAPPAPPIPAEPVKTAQMLKLGYADVLKIAEKSAPGKIAKAHFEAKADRFKAQIETKQKMLEKQKSTLEAKLPTYTPEKRAAKIKEYEKKVEELRKMLQNADKEMKPMQEELIREVYGKIESAARAYGGANGFSVILVKNDLLYLGSNVDVRDVTDDLIRYIDEKADPAQKEAK